MWQKTYGGSGDDNISSMEQTTDGGYIIGVASNSFWTDDYDFWVLKLDSNGSVLWQKTYGGEEDDYLHSVHQTTDGGYIVGGWTKSFGAGDYDFWILKLDSNGNVLWQKTYGGSQLDRVTSLKQTSDDGYIVAGFTKSFGAGENDIWVLKLQANGDIVWQRTYGGNSSEYPYTIDQTIDGGFILGGKTYSFSDGGYLLLKLNSNGDIPGCDMIIETSSASIISTSIEGINTNITGQSSSYDIETASPVANDTSAIISTVCCYDSIDSDGDTIGDVCDNCIFEYNPIQFDCDEDGEGDVCDSDTIDSDSDGVDNACDNCPDNVNPNQEDTDEDGLGDVCDNCPESYNPDQEDLDGDGQGNICDIDDDNDDTPDNEDNCPLNANPNQEDTDEDGLGDVCDNCPESYNPDQEDLDGDGQGNICDIDDDNDDTPDNEDNCPLNANPNQEDTDEDGLGDVCDNCPESYNPDQEDVLDEDGVGDICDNCPEVPNGPFLGTCIGGPLGQLCTNQDDCNGGVCSMNQEETNDGDALPDACDNCPNNNNPNQEDTYPPQGNGIGDACECEGNFDCDLDIDGGDAANFKMNFGRSVFFNPCESESPCNGDFDCDVDVDGTDAALFKSDFGRSPFHNPCAETFCHEGEWCIYDEIPFVGSYSNSGCLGGFMQDDGGYGCGDDEIIAESVGGVIYLKHFNAFYNCCPDDIAVTMTVEGSLLQLRETEINVGCRCMCCYTVESEIDGVGPGEYTIEYCWNYPGTPVCDTLSVTVSQ